MESMTRIALFHPSFGVPGGGELLCLSQAKALKRMGDEPALVTLAYDPLRWQSLLDGVPVEEIGKRRWTDLFHGWGRMAKLIRRGRRAEPFLRGFDVVLAGNHPCNAMLGASDLGARKVWQCNEPPRSLHPGEANPVVAARAASEAAALELCTREWREKASRHGALFHSRSRAALARYDIAQTARLDHVFAISEFSRNNARRIYGRCGQEVVNPIVSFPEGGHSRRGLDRSGLHLLVHGRLEVRKNVDTVIRGFTMFHRAHPACHLHVVGDGEARLVLEAIAATLLPPTACTFHGYLPPAELAAVYERCDVFALLTLDEPFGMVYPEAAAKGLLLIGPDHGGPKEILDDGRLGWCVDAFSPEALAQAFEEVWALPDAEVDRRRVEADRACRARYSEAVIGPQLRRVILEGHD